jgi:hypothetical protein
MESSPITGRRVRVGYYGKEFPICRANAPQVDDFGRVRDSKDARFEMFAKMGFQTTY